MNALVPCHSSTPKSLSKSSGSCTRGCAPSRGAPCRPWISAWGARETNASEVSRPLRWAGWATWSATNEQPTQARSGYESPSAVGGDLRPVEGAVDDQLAAAVEEVGQAGRAIRALEAVVLFDGHPGHPPPLGREGVACAHVLLLLHKQLLASRLPVLRGNHAGVFISYFLLQVVVDDVEQASPARPLGIHPVGGPLERPRVEREPVRAPVDHADDDAGLLEHLQVLGDRRLGDREVPGRLGDGGRALREPLDDPAADRMGECLERIVNHSVNSSRR